MIIMRKRMIIPRSKKPKELIWCHREEKSQNPKALKITSQSQKALKIMKKRGIKNQALRRRSLWEETSPKDLNKNKSSRLSNWS